MTKNGFFASLRCAQNDGEVEGRRQRTEDRGQRAEDRGQKTANNLDPGPKGPPPFLHLTTYSCDLLDLMVLRRFAAGRSGDSFAVQMLPGRAESEEGYKICSATLFNRHWSFKPRQVELIMQRTANEMEHSVGRL